MAQLVQIAYQSCFVLYLGNVVDSVHYIAGQSNANKTCPGLFLKYLLEFPRNYLEICSVKFVDTLQRPVLDLHTMEARMAEMT